MSVRPGLPALPRSLWRLIRKTVPTIGYSVDNIRWFRRQDKSQTGEQSLLSSVINQTGLYLEIGAYLPIKYSNSWRLRRAGWNGLSLDPGQQLAMQWRIFAPRSSFWPIAVTPDEVDSVQLFDFGSPVSTLSPDHALEWRQRAGRPRVRRVASISLKRTYQEFVSRYGRAPDLVMMDCEGLDQQLVNSLLELPEILWPTWLLVETTQFQRDTLKGQYVPRGETLLSTLYERDASTQRIADSDPLTKEHDA